MHALPEERMARKKGIIGTGEEGGGKRGGNRREFKAVYEGALLRAGGHDRFARMQAHRPSPPRLVRVLVQVYARTDLAAQARPVPAVPDPPQASL